MLRLIGLNSSHGHRQVISVSTHPTNRRVWMQRFYNATNHDSFRESSLRDRWEYFSLVGGAVRQRQDPLPFCAVIECAEASDFIEATHPVERVEVMGVVCRKLACLEITATQVLVAKRVRTLTRKKMKAQPT